MLLTADFGPKRTMTEEGYMICHDVPSARIGEQVYLYSELPEDARAVLTPDEFGLVYVMRDEEEVFAPEAMASFNGKPITDNHPPRGVDSKTWKDHAAGIMINPRRGEGALRDHMVTDWLIMDALAIDAINKGKRQVSMGYGATYQSLGAGRARQHKIRGNHGALVTNGRCGGSCSIGDEMDEATLKAMLEKLGIKPAATTTDTADATLIATIDTRLDAKLKPLGDTILAMGGKVQELVAAKPTTDTESAEAKAAREAAEAAKTKPAVTVDAATAGSKLAVLIGQAEILSPGIKFTTFDAAAATPAQIMDHVCSCQRSALAKAWATEDGKTAISPFIGDANPDFDKLPTSAIEMAFMGAAALRRDKNNQKFTAAAARPGATQDADIYAPIETRIEQMNREAAERWSSAKH